MWLTSRSIIFGGHAGFTQEQKDSINAAFCPWLRTKENLKSSLGNQGLLFWFWSSLYRPSKFPTNYAQSNIPRLLSHQDPILPLKPRDWFHCQPRWERLPLCNWTLCPHPRHMKWVRFDKFLASSTRTYSLPVCACGSFRRRDHNQKVLLPIENRMLQLHIRDTSVGENNGSDLDWRTVDAREGADKFIVFTWRSKTVPTPICGCTFFVFSDIHFASLIRNSFLEPLLIQH